MNLLLKICTTGLYGNTFWNSLNFQNTYSWFVGSYNVSLLEMFSSSNFLKQNYKFAFATMDTLSNSNHVHKIVVIDQIVF